MIQERHNNFTEESSKVALSLNDQKISLLNFNFVMIYIIHKMLVLLKNHLNYLKDNIVECSFKNHKRLYFMKKKLFFHNI